jgi:hypothetical protein
MKLPAFYPIVSSVRTAEVLLDAGVEIIQYRNKQFFSRAAFDDASRIAELCRQADALFVINDRADVAMLLNAALHLGQDDLAPSDARRILPAGSIIGFSTHNERQLRFGACRLFGHRSDFHHRIEAESRSGGRTGAASSVAGAHTKASRCNRRHHSRISAPGFQSGCRFGGRHQ